MEIQRRQYEWQQQWAIFRDDELFLFNDWIAPVTIEDFQGKTVLECGCGGGQHTSFIAPYAKSVTAVDLNTTEIARERNKQAKNVRFVDADIATMDLAEQFDIVMCLGVIHHTDDPDRSFLNMLRHCRQGGRMIVWTYSAEGNSLVRLLVEPVRKTVLRHLPRKTLVFLSALLTALLYPFVYSIYLMPFLTFLPYYDYFRNFRRLSFQRNLLNVFDKLNAPQVVFTTMAKCHEWFSPTNFESASISIRHYAGVSYSLTGVRRSAVVMLAIFTLFV